MPPFRHYRLFFSLPKKIFQIPWHFILCVIYLIIIAIYDLRYNINATIYSISLIYILPQIKYHVNRKMLHFVKTWFSTTAEEDFCMFWTKFVELCEGQGLKPRQVADEFDVAPATVTRWKHGSVPVQILWRRSLRGLGSLLTSCSVKRNIW